MSGRDEEFREFARSRAAPLHRSAYLLCGDWHLAHDLVQDTLVKAYRHWHRVQQADSSDAYIRRILLNEARQRWRRRDNATPVANVTHEAAVLDATDDIIRRAGLLQARTVDAVSTASSNSVLQTVATTADGVIRSTTDAPDQIWNVVYETSTGQKKSEIAMRKAAGAAGQVQAISINYTTQTLGEMNLGGGSIPNPATDFLKVFKPSPNGRVRFVGTAVIDGQAAYVINFTGLNDTRSTATDWISKATMLPIKSVSPGVTVSYQWSGPGSVSPATAWPSVPAGFTKVDPLVAMGKAKEGL